MKNKRIGLILASIHTGAAQNVWPSFVKTALFEEVSLFIFPGGRLNAHTDSENLRNSVYPLVNCDNLDGFVSWSSTIRYTESKEEFEEFHSSFDPLPYVTITYKIPDHPCVVFDAYTGMKRLVEHCIHVHGAKRIAFLRGPGFHPSALVRYRGYEDALREAGLPVMRNSPLVTDPFNWSSGDAAAAQLFETRKLRPGIDFDTLAGSSDLMTMGAINYLLKQGYHVPQDYRAIGFNNSVESRLVESPLSTVHIPYADLGSESIRILLKLLEKRKAGSLKGSSIGDVILPTEPIIRESCGCGGICFLLDAPEKEGRSAIGSSGAGEKASAGAEELTAMIASFLKLDAQDANALVAPVAGALFAIMKDGGKSALVAEHFINLFRRAFERFLNSSRDPELLFGLLEGIFRSGLVSGLFVRQLEPVLYRTIFKVSEQRAVHAQYEKEKWNTALNSLKCELLGAKDRISLVQSLARHLPKIGISAAGIALYINKETSLWAGSFSPEGIRVVREQVFPSKLLFPEQFRSEFSRGIFMVQPLFVENQSLGYFIHSVPVYDGVIFEELRSAVSYALKGIFQLEEVIRAKRTVENAEREKAELLKTLGNELRNPLGGIIEKIEDLEIRAKKAESLHNELEQLKSFVCSREEYTGNLIEAAFSGIGEKFPGKEFAGKDTALGVRETPGQPYIKGTILFIGEWANTGHFRKLSGESIHIPSMSVFNETVAEAIPEIIFFSSINADAAPIIRRHPVTVSVPIIMISDKINSAADVMTLSQYSRLVICHRSVASSAEFLARLEALREGDEILPPHTGALVKKTILYLDQHAESRITRWKLADAVYVNEDYLTRIFHREMGLSLWDYLNRLRIFSAADLLLQTDDSIQEISMHTGFQDPSYFCRVFRKIYGVSPGQLRKHQKKSE